MATYYDWNEKKKKREPTCINTIIMPKALDIYILKNSYMKNQHILTWMETNKTM